METLIAAAHALYFAYLAAQDSAASAHWADCVAAGTASGTYPGLSISGLPNTLGAGQIARYIGIAYPPLAKNKAALARSIKAACADGSITFAYKAKMSVSYGDGRGTASGFIAQRPLSYDRFERVAVDHWAAAQLEAKQIAA